MRARSLLCSQVLKAKGDAVVKDGIRWGMGDEEEEEGPQAGDEDLPEYLKGKKAKVPSPPVFGSSIDLVNANGIESGAHLEPGII
jgi:hypothetical protein